VCGPGCVIAPYCGDGVVSNGEACDEGATNGTGYGHCTTSCTLGPRCGDSLCRPARRAVRRRREHGSTADKCTPPASSSAGRRHRTGEQCDTRGEQHGRLRQVQPELHARRLLRRRHQERAEQCDDGKNDGSYGTCNPNCTIAGYCGDATLQILPRPATWVDEQLVGIRPDGVHEPLPPPPTAEQQVDGQCRDSATTASQRPRRYSARRMQVLHPATSCGNGTMRARTVRRRYEQRHRQQQVRHHCRLSAARLRDTGEQCDDGVNNGATARATANCTFRLLRRRPSRTAWRAATTGEESAGHAYGRDLHDGVHVRALLRRPPRRGAVGEGVRRFAVLPNGSCQISIPH